MTIVGRPALIGHVGEYIASRVFGIALEHSAANKGYDGRFTDGPLAGLKLLGFAIWERKTGPGRNVTFPARNYSVNGATRSFVLLRSIADEHPLDGLRDQILHAYEVYVADMAVAS